MAGVIQVTLDIPLFDFREALHAIHADDRLAPVVMELRRMIHPRMFMAHALHMKSIAMSFVHQDTTYELTLNNTESS